VQALCEGNETEIDALVRNREAIALSESVHLLGNGVTLENLRARIHRGSLAAYQDERGDWYVTKSEVKRITEEVESCHSCSNLATSYGIVKYHHHHRIEFMLCPDCAQKAQAAYSRKGGVIEIVAYPLQGEGWMKP
jgi:hypothetical protein